MYVCKYVCKNIYVCVYVCIYVHMYEFLTCIKKRSYYFPKLTESLYWRSEHWFDKIQALLFNWKMSVANLLCTNENPLCFNVTSFVINNSW